MTTLREAELSRSLRATRAHTKQQKRKKKGSRGRSVGIGHNMGPAFAPLLDDRCMTFAEWCQLNGIGKRTGRRILDGPNTPEVVQLSPRRIGITVRANRRWQEQRAKPKPTDETVGVG